MNTLNENIVRLRKQAGMTQEELGRRVMVSTQAVSRWERGGSPDIALLPAIAQVFSVTLDELFGRESEKTIPVEEMLTRDIQSAPETERFERAWRLCWHIMKAVAAADNGPSGDAYFRFMSGSEDVEHADSAKTAAPATRRPGKRRVVKVRFAKRTPASSHTPG